MNYDMHVGAVLRLPGKLLAFFSSMIAASLPVTGFVIWWGRKKRTKLAADSSRKHVVRNIVETKTNAF